MAVLTIKKKPHCDELIFMTQGLGSNIFSSLTYCFGVYLYILESFILAAEKDMECDNI